MGKFSGILICSDLDGTLLDRNKEISQENLKALDYFMKNGGCFALSTGRSPSFIKELEKKGIKPNSPVIALNGAMIYDIENDKCLYKNPIDKEKLLTIDDFISKNKEYINNVVYHTDKDVDSFSEIESDNNLYKIVFVSDSCKNSKKLRQNIEEKYEDFFITNSWPEGLELLASDSTKGVCIEKMRKLLGEKAKKIVCVGDYENDISMLRVADVSYAVENAIPEVKAAASRVTVSNNESAIAKIIEDLEKDLIYK